MNAHPNRYLQALATGLQHEKLEAYLQRSGTWTPAPSRRAEVTCYKHTSGRWIQIPVDRDLADYTRALIYASTEIAELEGRSAEALLLELVPPLYAAKLLDPKKDEFPDWIDAKSATELRAGPPGRVLVVRLLVTELGRDIDPVKDAVVSVVWEGDGDFSYIDFMLNEAFALGRKLGR